MIFGDFMIFIYKYICVESVKITELSGQKK